MRYLSVLYERTHEGKREARALLRSSTEEVHERRMVRELAERRIAARHLREPLVEGESAREVRHRARRHAETRERARVVVVRLAAEGRDAQRLLVSGARLLEAAGL